MGETIESIEGYLLFNDVEDDKFRIWNQGMALANIFEDNSFGGRITDGGYNTVMEYMEHIPKEERSQVYKVMADELTKRGFKHGS